MRHVDRIVLICGAAVAAGVLILALRLMLPGSTSGHLYLLWNTVLAGVPLIAALALVRRRRRRMEAIALGAVWLAFLPNAPYLVTDLVHLPERGAPGYWPDLVLLSTFGLIGLLLGSASIYLVHVALRSRGAIGRGWLLVAAIAPLTGIGVALGRFARWNSWDLLVAPQRILGDVLDGLLDPLAHQQELTLAVAITVLVIGSYAVFFALLESGHSAGAAPGGRRSPEEP